MTLCPVAMAVGCKKCPIFSVCPAKSLIGDQPAKSAEPTSGSQTRTGKSKK